MKAKENWKSRKLNDEDIAGILFMGKEGSASQREIADIYKVTQAYVSRLLAGKASRVEKAGA